MSFLLAQITSRAAAALVPLSVHLDVTYRCNEKCIHCYVDQTRREEMTQAEIEALLVQLADAGTLFLSISGGEVLLREDLFGILERARSLLFHVTLKTNGTWVGEREAKRIAELAISQVHISIYSHQPSVHDAITRLPGSFERSVAALRLLSRYGVRARIVTVLMARTAADYPGIQRLAADLGVELRVDPTVTPAMDGGNGPTALRAPIPVLRTLFRDPSVVTDADEFCAPPPAPDAQILDDYLCSAGRNLCYISPSGDVMPCVQFPLACGNVRASGFRQIWRNSEALARIRAMRVRDLPVCGGCANVAGCTRCPGLAYAVGDMFGPSPLDCEKAYARTGLLPPPSARLVAAIPLLDQVAQQAVTSSET